MALGALALATPAAAHQKITFELTAIGHRVVIDGDQDGKVNDLITVRFSPGTGFLGADEYVFTHDIVGPLPSECEPVGEGPPWKEVRCPAAGIVGLVINAGQGNNTIDINGLAHSPLAQASLGAIQINFPGDGKTRLLASAFTAPTEVTGGSGSDDIQTGEGSDEIDAGGGENNVESGEGDDRVETGDGNQKVDLGGGDNTATLGNGNSKVTVGAGDNHVQLGDGNSVFDGPPSLPVMRPALGLLIGSITDTVSFGNGTSHYNGGPENDVATFGSGDSVFSGSGGDDQATFGAGDNKFSGGEGNDASSMGSGRDRFYGGGGEDWGKLGEGQDQGYGEADKDRIFGGTGNDKLFGGPDFDRLFGGAGKLDLCRSGGGGGGLKGCER